MLNLDFSQEFTFPSTLTSERIQAPNLKISQTQIENSDPNDITDTSVSSVTLSVKHKKICTVEVAISPVKWPEEQPLSKREVTTLPIQQKVSAWNTSNITSFCHSKFYWPEKKQPESPDSVEVVYLSGPKGDDEMNKECDDNHIFNNDKQAEKIKCVGNIVSMFSKCRNNKKRHDSNSGISSSTHKRMREENDDLADAQLLKVLRENSTVSHQIPRLK